MLLLDQGRVNCVLVEDDILSYFICVAEDVDNYRLSVRKSVREIKEAIIRKNGVDQYIEINDRGKFTPIFDSAAVVNNEIIAVDLSSGSLTRKFIRFSFRFFRCIIHL